LELIYKNPGFDYMINNILMFQTDVHSDFWRESLFLSFPLIDKNHFNNLDKEKRKNYLYEILLKIYESEKQNIYDKLVKYNNYRDNNKKQIEESFTNAFQIDCKNNFNNIVGNISLNPIEPRWLDITSFDVFYLNSERGALGTALHEIVHFVWFFVWQKHFKDDITEYETPHIKWIFSEMVVDSVIRGNTYLSDINPYFQNGCAYSFFYRMIIEGKPILETLYSMYKSLNIIDFMEKGYEYCIKNESAIRIQMK